MFKIIVLAAALCLAAAAQSVNNGGIGGGGGTGTPNYSCTGGAGASTGCTITGGGFSITTAQYAQSLLGCFTSTGPVAATWTTSGSPITSIAFSYSSTSGVSCAINLSGVNGSPGTGTVSSVSQTVPSWLTVTGSPITTTGTLAITPTTAQTSHQVIGTCGSATTFAPCLLVAGDLPTITLTGDTTGTASGGSIATTTSKINGVALSGLATGLLKNTTGTGVPSIGVSGTDYAPATNGTSAQVLTSNGAGAFGTALSLGANVATFFATPSGTNFASMLTSPPLPRSVGGTNNTAGAIAQQFFGTAAPGSVAGNLPGDFFSDTTNHNDYWCNAVSGTAAPACTSVISGGWTLLNGGGTSAGGFYATSSTSRSILGTGSVTWTTQSGLAYATGVYATACSISAPTSCFYGIVTAYSGTTLTVNTTANSTGGGTGPFTDWQFTGALVPQVFSLTTTGNGASSLTGGVLNIPFLTSGTSGATVGLLNGNLTFSGTNAYGTPTSITLTNGTGLPVAGLTGLGTGVGTALGTAVSGTGAICLASGSSCSGGASPTFQTGGAGGVTASTMNVVASTGLNGITMPISNVGGVATYTPAIDYTLIPSIANIINNAWQGVTATRTSASTYAATITGFPAYAQNQSFTVTFPHNCEGTDTLNVTGVGPIPFYKVATGNTVVVDASGDCTQGAPFDVKYSALFVGGSPTAAFVIQPPNLGAGTGTVTSVGLLGTANQLTVTGASPITSSGSWTLSLPAAITLPGTLTAPSLSTSGTVAGSICATSAGLVLYESGGNCYAGGSSALSGITAATGANTIASGNNGLQIWNWAPTTNQVQMQFGETTAATSGTLGNQYIAKVVTLAGSTAVPVNITDSLTGSQTLPALHITPTWNTTGVVDAAVLVNVTNTASGALSKILDLQIGGTSEFNVDKSGNIVTQGSLSLGPSAPSGITAGTAGLWVPAIGTAPSGITTGAGGIWLDSTQGGFLSKIQTNSILPIPQGPASTTNGHAACWSGTVGALLTDCGAPGTGTVTSAAETFTGGLISVGGSPITTSGTFALTVAGTSGGIPYFSSTSAWASSGLLGAGQFVLGGGAGTSPTSANISGDCTTSASAVITCTQINGSNLTVSSAGLMTKIDGITTVGTGTPILGWQSVLTNSSATSLVTLATAPTAGDYELHYSLDLHTACTTGTANVTLAFGWTANSARTETTGGWPITAAQTTSSFFSGVQPIHVVSGNVTFTPAIVTSCTTGSATWDGLIWMERVN